MNMFTFTCDYTVTAHFYMTSSENILDLYSDKHRITWLCQLQKQMLCKLNSGLTVENERPVISIPPFLLPNYSNHSIIHFPPLAK